MTGADIERYVPQWATPWMPAECWGRHSRNRGQRRAYWRQRFFAQHHWQCSLCGKSAGDASAPVSMPMPGQDVTLRFTYPVSLTIDHVVPLARGGCSHAHNLAVVCDQCNNSKGDRLPWEPRPRNATANHNLRASVPASWTLERTP